MLKVLAVAALVLSGSAFLFESHAMIWLVLAVLPGSVAVLFAPAPRREPASPKHMARAMVDPCRSLRIATKDRSPAAHLRERAGRRPKVAAAWAGGATRHQDMGKSTPYVAELGGG